MINSLGGNINSFLEIVYIYKLFIHNLNPNTQMPFGLQLSEAMKETDLGRKPQLFSHLATFPSLSWVIQSCFRARKPSKGVTLKDSQLDARTV